MMNKSNKNASIDGIGSIPGGEYDVVSVDGIGKIKGKVICNELKADGLLKIKHKITAQSFNCDGFCRIFHDVKFKTVTIDGLLKLRRARLEADSIKCDGFIISNSEISADEIFIEGACSVAEMYGDRITLKSESFHNLFNKVQFKSLLLLQAYFGRKISMTHSLVDFIECTELTAENLKSKLIRAHTITLGENCEIDAIECTGELRYHKSCKLGRISCKNVIQTNVITSEKSNSPINSTSAINSTNSSVNSSNSSVNSINSPTNLTYSPANSTNTSTNLAKGVDKMSNISLRKILDMYKNETLNADEAEQMIIALMAGNGGTSPNDENILSSYNDDKLRIIVAKGNKLISRHDYHSGISINVEYQGEALDVECWGNITCGNIMKNANAGGKIICGDVGGNINCGGSVSCKSVNGKIMAGGGVHINYNK